MNEEFREDPPASSGDARETDEVSTTKEKEKGTPLPLDRSAASNGIGRVYATCGHEPFSLAVIAVVSGSYRCFSARHQMHNLTLHPHRVPPRHLLWLWKKLSLPL